eukprot:6225238-Ditylum_brightwellii.AAC.1
MKGTEKGEYVYETIVDHMFENGILKLKVKYYNGINGKIMYWRFLLGLGERMNRSHWQSTSRGMSRNCQDRREPLMDGLQRS